MPKPCPSVHHHPAFERSFDSRNKDHTTQEERVTTRLKTGNQAGLKKGADLNPLYGFPEGHKSIRILYIKCSDCRKKFFKTPCTFCGTEAHTMDDTVLPYVNSAHDQAYKEAKKLVDALKNPAYQEFPR